jgi:hypothetical protein
MKASARMFAWLNSERSEAVAAVIPELVARASAEPQTGQLRPVPSRMVAEVLVAVKLIALAVAAGQVP